jgi:hypothetical protein
MILTTQPLPPQAPILSKRPDDSQDSTADKLLSLTKREENRRENLRRLIKDADGPKNFAAKLGYANPSFLVQMAGPHPSRVVTDKTARRFEAKLGLPDGALDWPVENKGRAPASVRVVSKPDPAPASGDTALTMDVIQLVARTCAAENLQLPPLRFADIVQFALLQAIETGQAPSEEALRRLIALVTK